MASVRFNHQALTDANVDDGDNDDDDDDVYARDPVERVACNATQPGAVVLAVGCEDGGDDDDAHGGDDDDDSDDDVFVVL